MNQAIEDFSTKVNAFMAAIPELVGRTTPPCPLGLIEYTWAQEHITVICHLDYEAEERGSRQGGQQQEPDYPASMTLFAAYIGSVDISGELDPEAIDAVEGLALYEVQA